MTPLKDRLAGPDLLRACGCLIVFFHHVAGAIDLDTLTGGYVWLRGFIPIGGYGVVIFFVLSGFLLSRPFWKSIQSGAEAPNLKIYALRRAARIAPGYWLALTVSALLGLLIGHAQLSAETFTRYVSGMLFVSNWRAEWLFPAEINGPLWSISFEVGCYALLPLSFAAFFVLGGRNRTPFTALGLMGGVLACSLLFHYLFIQVAGDGAKPDFAQEAFSLSLIGRQWFPSFNLFGMFATFGFGILASGLLVLKPLPKNRRVDLLAGAAWAATLLFLFAIPREPDTGANLFGWLDLPYDGYPTLPFLIAALLYLTPSTIRIGRLTEPKLVQYIAEISFGIYIWHSLVLEVVNVALSRLFVGSGSTPLEAFLLVVLSIIGTWIVSDLSWRLIERPAINWGRRREKLLLPASREPLRT